MGQIAEWGLGLAAEFDVERLAAGGLVAWVSHRDSGFSESCDGPLVAMGPRVLAGLVAGGVVEMLWNKRLGQVAEGLHTGGPELADGGGLGEIVGMLGIEAGAD